MIEYKHKGKPNENYLIQVWLDGDQEDVEDLPDYVVIVSLKGNSFKEVHVPPPTP